MTSAEKGFVRTLQSYLAKTGGLESYTQGLKIQSFHKGKKKLDLEIGEVYPYYDLASLTKVIFTVSSLVNLTDLKRAQVNNFVSDNLNWWRDKKTKNKDFLTHSAGLPAWAPIYEKIKMISNPVDRREKLKMILAGQKTNRKQKAIYSDLDFLMLGFLIEKLSASNLLQAWQNLPISNQLRSLHFNVNNRPIFKRAQYAPTEDCPWRNKVLRGEVHDDNTWALGGVSSHAGLFGKIEDVSQFCLEWRKGLKGEMQNIGSPATIQRFSRRSIAKEKGDWALGLMMPTKGSSSCGKYFSSRSIGHTGFTGTSLWIDPKSDFIVTILSNRVYPTRDNRAFVGLRPRLHDFAFEHCLK